MKGFEDRKFYLFGKPYIWFWDAENGRWSLRLDRLAQLKERVEKEANR